MRHRVAGYKLKRTTNERRRLFRQLIRSLILHECLHTTKAKAEAIQSLAEKLVSKARENTRQAIITLDSYIADKALKERLQKVILPKLINRAGGYTQLIHLPPRSGDNAQYALLQWAYTTQSKQDKSETSTQLVTEKTVKKSLAPKAIKVRKSKKSRSKS